jgi:glucose/mannose-6-phosphate isomerase
VSDPLDPIRAVDAAGQLETVLAMPDHLRDVLWRVESARLTPQPAPALIACGMGGSGIGGELARAAIGRRLQGPIRSARSYALPPEARPEDLILCSSYSGSTEETLACFEAAGELGAKRIVATTGGALEAAAREAGAPVIGLPSGMQPRAAVGYMFGAACEVAALAGVAPRLREEIEAAAAHLEDRREAIAARSLELVERLGEGAAVIYGCDLTVPVAYRWKTQINENCKIPAFWHELPEADHNELVAWEGAGEAVSLAAVFLLDRDQSDRERRRIELTAKLIGDRARAVELIEVEGETRTARLFEAVLLGDLVSLQIAARRGIDPSPVELIERLKDELGRP